MSILILTIKLIMGMLGRGNVETNLILGEFIITIRSEDSVHVSNYKWKPHIKQRDCGVHTSLIRGSQGCQVWPRQLHFHYYVLTFSCNLTVGKFSSQSCTLWQVSNNSNFMLHFLCLLRQFAIHALCYFLCFVAPTHKVFRDGNCTLNTNTSIALPAEYYLCHFRGGF